MPGASLKVELTGVTEAERRLRALAAAGQDLTPAMRDIGQYLVNVTKQRFADQKDPEGMPWAPLSEHTKARKRRNPNRILTEHGHLGGDIVSQASAAEVLVGSPWIYAGPHQFGAEKGSFGSAGGSPIPWGDIPAREFLGLSEADEDEVEVLVRDFLMSLV